MSRAAVPHGASAARAPHWLPVVPGTRGDGAVSNEAIVKLFTSCLVKRDHSVVEMKVFEIFISVYMVLEWKTSGKQTKKTPNLQSKSLLAYVWGWWLAGVWEEMTLLLDV